MGVRKKSSALDYVYGDEPSPHLYHQPRPHNVGESGARAALGGGRGALRRIGERENLYLYPRSDRH